MPVVVHVTKLGKPVDADDQGIDGQTGHIPPSGGAAIQEIDRLIDQLWNLREFLLREGETVQLKIDEYSETSQSSMRSAQLIGDILGSHLRRAALSASNAERGSPITGARLSSRELTEAKEERYGAVRPAPINDLPAKGGMSDLKEKTINSAVAVALDMLTQEDPDISKAVRFLRRAQTRYNKNEV